MARPTVLVEADFLGDSSWSTALNSYIVGIGNGFSINRGVDNNLTYSTSQLSFTLTNRSREFSRENESSTLYGKIDAGVKVRVKVNGTVIWQGHISRYGWTYDAANKEYQCEVEAQDLGFLIQSYNKIQVPYSTSYDVDGAMQAVVDQITPAITGYSLDDSPIALDYYWEGYSSSLTDEERNAWDALLNLTNHDLGGVLFVNKSNTLRFITGTSLLGITADRTWGQGTSIKPFYEQYRTRFEDIATRVKVDTQTYEEGPGGTVVIYEEDIDTTNPDNEDKAIKIQPYEIREYDATYDYVISSMTTPVYTTDYTVNSKWDGSGLDMQSSLTFSCINNGTYARVFMYNFSDKDMFVTKMRIRGTVVSPPTETTSFAETLSSPSIFNQSGEYNVSLNYLDDRPVVHNYMYSQLRIKRYANPILTLKFNWGAYDESDSTTTTDMIALELYDGVYYKSVTSTGSESDDYWRVVSIDHSIVIGGLFETTVTLVPSHIFRDSQNVVWDNFEREDTASALGTSPTGYAWTNISNGIHISSNKAAANNTGYCAVNINTGRDDHVVEALFEQVDGTKMTFGVTIGTNSSHTNDFWQVLYEKDGATSRIRLFKAVGGITYGYVVSFNFTPNSSQTIEMRAIKVRDKLKVWIDGVLRINYKDSQLINSGKTYAGVFMIYSTTLRGDNFYAQGL